jgi:N-acetyl sugar amidotransferase
MKYCKRCLYPSTKPDIVFNSDGICSACTAFDQRDQIDWNERANEFAELVDHIKKNRKSNWDCVVPVSGGKDSTYQIIKVLEYGLNPLAVTAFTDDLSHLGYRNLANISDIGVDHIMVRTNNKVRRKIARYGLRTVGDISYAEHVTIFSIPFREAILRNIPLIIWGENPQNEYGGPLNAQGVKILDNKWLQEFGGLNGLRITDLVDKKILSAREAELYRFPKDAGYMQVRGLFLGHYFSWDGYHNFIIAKKNGFKEYDIPVESSGFTYENLDNLQTGIHDYFKYIKFGFGRATDICNNHIRRGRMTRETAIKKIERWDGNYPISYLGIPLCDILSKIDMTEKDFVKIIEKFTNKELFTIDKYSIPKPKFKVGEGL